MCDEATEINACKELVETYRDNYQDNSLFHIRSLESVIRDIHPINNRILLLYFHNDDRFSDEFCSFICKENAKEFIKDNNCYMIGWKLSKDNNKQLRDVVKKIFGFGTVYETLYREQSAIFLITTSKPTVFFHMKEFVEEELLLTSLKAAIKSNEILECASENNLCSRRFQQIMYDRLGDRDYDCFEPNEHEYLKNKLYFSIYGAPKTAKTDNEKQRTIDGIYKTIRSANNKYSKWNNKIVMSFIYNCTEPLDPTLDRMAPVPVFVLRKCKGGVNSCRLFIDLDLRVYKSWKGYLRQNRLPKCKMILPRNGKYKGDVKGDVLLEKHFSPQCSRSTAALKTVDKTATAIGIASGVGMLIGIALPPVGIVSGVIGISCAVYSTTRISVLIHDRRIHYQSMSISNPEARSAYLGIASNTIGVLAGGVTKTVSVVASRGLNVGKIIIASANALNYVSLATDIAGLVNFLNDVRYSKLGTMEIIQLTFAVLFFNNAIISIGNSRGRILENEIKSMLRNTKFNYRQRANGRKEIIKELHNVHSKNQIKNLNNNSHGSKFAIQNGRVLLNGISVQILKHTALNVQGLYLPPSAPTLSETDKMNICFELEKTFLVKDVTNIRAFGVKLIKSELDVIILGRDLLSRFPRYMHRHLIEITTKLVRKLEDQNVNFVEIFENIFLCRNHLYKIAEVVVRFLESKFEKEHHQLETFSENNEKFLDMLDDTLRAYTLDDEDFLMELLQYFLNWLTTITYEYENRNIKKIERRNGQKFKKKIYCNLCGGYYYKK